MKRQHQQYRNPAQDIQRLITHKGRYLITLCLLLSLSACAHGQVKQQFGGVGSIGGVTGIQSNVTPVFQITNTVTSCPQGTLFSPYTCQLTTANGNGNVTYSIISGSLPNGASIVGSQIVGTSLSPNAGQYTFTLKATDSASTPNTATLPGMVINVGCPPVALSSPLVLPPAQQSTAYSFTFQQSGGVSPFTFSSVGPLPTGETLSSAGVLSGTPSIASNNSFSVSVADSCNLGAQTDTATFSEKVNSNLAVTTASLPSGVALSPYNQTLSVAGGTGPYIWTLASGPLPNGLSLLSSGVISGTPTTPGVFPITVTVTDSLSNAASANLSITITCRPLSIATQSPLPSCTQGQNYNFTMNASPAGFGALSWTAPGLPSIGLAISNSGVITGTCSQVGTLNATINVSDSCPAQQTQSGTFAITINPQIPQLGFSTTSPLQTPTTGIAFTQQVNGQGGAPPYTFALIGGSFPTGISMNVNGLISGTATQAATTSPILQVTDSQPVSFSQTFSMTSVCATLSNNTASLSAATQGSAYSAQINASGGSGALSYTASGLPTGLSIGLSTGLISGTPSTSGSFTVTVTITDSCSPTPQTLPKTYTLNVTTNLAITTLSLPNGTQGSAYSGTVSAAGGQTPYSFAVTAGAQPTSLSLSAAGVLSGTPSAAGTFNFTVTVTDGLTHTAAQAYTVIISASGAATCGAGIGGAALSNQNACGNYVGAPYEDLSTASPNTAPAPTGTGALHTLSACTSFTPAAGDVWRLTADINDGAGGTNQNCLKPGNNAGNFVLDLAGHTLLGGIGFPSGGFNGITIVNGTINCNIANGGIAGCIELVSGGIPTKSVLLSHLTVNNANSPTAPDTAVVTAQHPGGFFGFEYVIYVENDGTTSAKCTAGPNQKTFNGACVEVAHVNTTPAAGYTGAGYVAWCARCTNIYIASGGATAPGEMVEVWNTVTNCGGFIDACQGVVLFNTAIESVHNSNFPFTLYQGSSDGGRAILFDSAGKKFNNSSGSATNNYIAAFNNRALRTRQENGIGFSNNLVDHIQGGTTIHEGENDDYAEKLDKNTIVSNRFVMEGGTAINIRSAYAVVADSNTFVCGSSCNTGSLAQTDLGGNYVFNIQGATRTAQCVVTLTLTGGPSSTSSLGGLFVNLSGTSSSFDVSATAGNTVTTRNGAVFTYTQQGCAGAASIGAGGTFWISQIAADAFAANGSQFYIKNSTVDPLLIMSQPFFACGTASPACRFTPQALNSGQTQIKACSNLKSAVNVPAVGGTGALVQNLTGTCP